MPSEEGQIRHGIYFEVGSVPFNGLIASCQPDLPLLLLLTDPKEGLRTDISQGREWLNFFWLKFPSA